MTLRCIVSKALTSGTTPFARTSFAYPCASAADEDLDVHAIVRMRHVMMFSAIFYMSRSAKAKSRNEYGQCADDKPI